MIKLTKAQRKAYLQDPNHCPICNSDYIHGDEVNVDANTAYQEITCDNCEAYWFDCYTMTDIELQEIPDEVVKAKNSKKSDLPLLIGQAKYPYTKALIERRLKG